MIYITEVDDYITDNLILKLDELKDKKDGISYNTIHTKHKNGFQTKNIMNDASIEEILHKILSYLPYPNDYQYRWFHMIDYEQGGLQAAHDHARTENYSYVLYLTSCNHGGETCFKLDQEIQIKPKKNTLIFFPSTILHWGKTTIDHKKVAVGALIGNFK
jgi:hypothetical protein